MQNKLERILDKKRQLVDDVEHVRKVKKQYNGRNSG
jgi:hypothetical protein